MVDVWYYGHERTKIGPFSRQQMLNMAASGEILPVDTVWKQGVEKGMSANRVKNLFAPPPAPQSLAAAPSAQSDSLSEQDTPVPFVIEAAVPSAETGTEAAPPAQAVRAPLPQKKKQGRALALKGADILNQDGVQARYRMKCTECGHKDSATHVISLIMSKSYKLGFYCKKCKKRREVGIQTYAG